MNFLKSAGKCAKTGFVSTTKNKRINNLKKEAIF